MEINGKELKLRLDLGAFKRANKICKKNILALEGSAYADPEVLTALLLAAAERGGSDVTMEDIDSLPIDKLGEVMEEVQKMVEGFGPQGEADPLANPQA